MSSTSGLSRTRSLRKPATSSAGSTNQKENSKLAPPPSSNDAGKASPSRLPQVKPLIRSATTTASTTASARARATNPTRTSTASAAAPAAPTTTTTTGVSRPPLSGILSSRNGLTTTRRASPTTGENTAAAARPLGRTPTARHAPSASANMRSVSRESAASPQRPSSSGGVSSTSTTLSRSKTLGHSRAKSTATGLTAATTLKPPSSRVSTAASSIVSTKPTTRSQTLQARGTTHRAFASISAATSAAAATAAPSLPAAGQNRPAFNTNQQHFSPLKSHAPKPLTSTFLAPPSPSKLPSNVAISAETARLQTELLQLSLLHRDAGHTAAEWHESAQRKLGARFTELVRAEQALGGRERDGVEARNAAVLVRWGATQASTEIVGGLEEKVQMLDQVVNGVWRFGEPGGRYARVVEEFEVWAGRLQGIMEARRKGDLNSLLGSGIDDDGKGGEEVLFIGDLENRWRDECPGLVRKLEEWRRILRHLGPVPVNAPTTTTTEEGGESGGQKSSLAKILEGCTGMVDDMLTELALMEQMVREAVRAEDDWIEAMNKGLNLGNEKDTPGDRSAPLWKMVV
ncbi:hypothetical protein PG996_001128 [Apiospora saccharicola]|uniref:Uncharacterized protein n=1 Tax=Apiospora saccharicola TaxID=335842 RepID=A0ABR1WFW1_9PEZI